MSLPRRPSTVSRARRALGDLREHVDAATMRDLRLVVSELVTNSVRHSRASAEEPVAVEVSVTSRKVRIEVIDRGLGFQPEPPAQSPGQDSGWGLLLVQQLADRWGVRSRGGTCVWAEIDQRS
jgi:anti-sigma regulatory factor (Ser/Thr protein kinase)